MLVHSYPLEFDLSACRTPWNDPGRVRNEALFRAVWFDSQAAARTTLTCVSCRRGGQRAEFQVTKIRGVHVQRLAAQEVILALGTATDRNFDSTGGSFNWRAIAGTDRLSEHSYGTAAEFDSHLGSYWRCSGAAPGQAADFDNAFPAELVRAMERRGFVRGGKVIGSSIRAFTLALRQWNFRSPCPFPQPVLSC